MSTSNSSTQFKNGSDVHFDYTSHQSLHPESMPTDTQNPTLNGKKKKKKKKKGKNSISAARNLGVDDANIYDVDAEYPQSRLIKVDANGDVVIESLDDEYPPEDHVKQVPHNSFASPLDPYEMSTRFELAMIQFRDDAERTFWKELSEEKRMEITSIDVDTINEKFKQQKKAWTNRMNNGGQGSDGSRLPHAGCSCPHCGRNSPYVQEELANVYQPYLEEFVRSGLYFPEKLGYQQIQEHHDEQQLRQRNLREGQHLDEQDFREHYSLNIQDEQLPTQPAPQRTHEEPQRVEQKLEQLQLPEENDEHLLSEELHDSVKLEEMNSQQGPENEEEEARRFERISSLLLSGEVPESTNEIYERLIRDLEYHLPHEKLLFKNYDERIAYMELERTRLLEIPDLPEMWRQRIMVDDFLLQDVDRARVIKEKARIPLNELHPEVQKKFLAQRSPLLPKIMDFFGDSKVDNFNTNFADRMASFADMIVKNDGKSFVDIIEAIKHGKDMDEGKIGEVIDEEVEGDDPELEHYALKNTEEHHPISHSESALHDNDTSPDDDCASDLEDQECGYDDHCEHHDCDHSHDEEYDYHHNHEHGYTCDHDHDHEDMESDNEEYDEESDIESEHNKQERIKELRGFFMIQAIHVIRQRFREAYEKKLSEDRTRKFIEELEAEETARKEKELKKLKQKEKQQEKKRLQKLAKEEEKKRKEAEELAKTAERKKREDELREEQLRRKEELRLKKEEEKQKKIEALKKKEREQLESLKKKEIEQKIAMEARNRELAAQELSNMELKRAKELLRRTKEAEEAKRTVEQVSKIGENISLPEFVPAQLSNPVPLAASMAIPNTLMNAMNDEADSLSDALVRGDPIQPMDPNIRASPAKNHLLEQLYQARPRSVSSVSTATPTFNNLQLAGNPTMSGNPSMSGAVYSPVKKGALGPENDMSFSSWNPSLPNTFSTPSTQAQGSAFFSPFTDAGAADGWNCGPLSETFQPSMANPALNGRMQSKPSMWNAPYNSRSNSIWNNAQSTASGSTVWGAQPEARPPLASETSASAIQAAAFQATQMLEQSNLASFGMAPAVKVFQVAKSLLKNSTLGMAEFLGSLRSSGQFHFDLIYDDFGSVTHIVAKATGVPGVQPIALTGMQPFQAPLGQPAPGDVHAPSEHSQFDFGMSESRLSFSQVNGIW